MAEGWENLKETSAFPLKYIHSSAWFAEFVGLQTMIQLNKSQLELV